MKVNERRLEYLVSNVRLTPGLSWYECDYRRVFQIRSSGGGIYNTYISYIIIKDIIFDPPKWFCVPVEYSPLWEDDRIINKLQFRIYNFYNLKREFNPDGGDLGREESGIPQPK